MTLRQTSSTSDVINRTPGLWLRVKQHSFTVAALGFAAPVLMTAQVLNSPFAIYESPTLLDPGLLWIGAYGGSGNTRGGRWISGPSLDFGLGLNSRLEISGYAGLTSYQDDSARFFTSVDDGYFGLKALLLTEKRYRPAIALKPTLEVLSSGSDRAHFVLPVIFGKQNRFGSFSYTAGYAMRGVMFNSMMCEWEIGRLYPFAFVSASRATKGLGELRELGLKRSRIDSSVGIVADVTRRWSFYVEAGRTLGRHDDDSSRFEFAAGIAFTGRLWGKADARKHLPMRR